MNTLAIIGTAGRQEDGVLLSQDPVMYYEKMLAACLKVVAITKADTLISGGAAYADHCAVSLFLKAPNVFKLILELPANLVADNADGLCFQDSGAKSPGSIANYYHNRFTKAMQKEKGLAWSSFADFRSAVTHPNCVINVTPGFKERNLKVAAKANHCLAMTFGDKHFLKDGGTAHTMKNFLEKKTGSSYHLDLNVLRLYKGAKIYE